MAAWPGTLPQEMLQDGYQETAPSATIRSNMDVGPAKVRRRTSAATRMISGAIFLTMAQVEILDAFYINDCAQGSISFTWVHPRTRIAVSFRFVKPPVYQPDGSNFTSSLELEILP